MQEPGFHIDGKHYPFPESYTLGQTILVSRITRDEFYKFAEAIQVGQRGGGVEGALLLGEQGLQTGQALLLHRIVHLAGHGRGGGAGAAASPCSSGTAPRWPTCGVNP